MRNASYYSLSRILLYDVHQNHIITCDKSEVALAEIFHIFFKYAMVMQVSFNFGICKGNSC